MITAREELHNHLKYLVGYDDANKMIDEYKEEVLAEINFYELRNEILESIKDKIIKNINNLMPVSCRTITLYQDASEKLVSKHQIDRDEVIKKINDTINNEKINGVM